MGAMTGVDALADTSAFIALEQGRPLRETMPEALAVSYVTVAELRVGLLMAMTPDEQRQRWLTLAQVEQLRPLRVDREVAQVWAEMQETLREAGRTLRTNDSWIAATAVAHGLPLVTQDSDYARIPGLEVVQV
jgi:predicted nucleic acid-binding protein